MLQRKNLSIFTFYKGAGDHFSWRKTSNTWNVRQKQCLTPMLYSYYTYIHCIILSLPSSILKVVLVNYLQPDIFHRLIRGALVYCLMVLIAESQPWPDHFMQSSTTSFFWVTAPSITEQFIKQLPQNLAPGQIMVFLRVGVLNTGLPLTRKVVLLFAPDILKS